MAITRLISIPYTTLSIAKARTPRATVYGMVERQFDVLGGGRISQDDGPI